jgi:hypothetical protein
MSARAIIAVGIVAAAIITLAACSRQSDATGPSAAPQATTGSGATGTTVQLNGAIDVINARIPALPAAPLAPASPPARPNPDRILLTGLRRPLRLGQAVTITLTFAHAGQATLRVPVTPPVS